MIICDRCKRVPRGNKYEPFLYEISGFKMEETKVGKKGGAVGREIIKIQMHLCDPCISAFNKDLGYFIHGVRENETIEIQNNPAMPVGITERDFGDIDEKVQANAEKLANQHPAVEF